MSQKNKGFTLIELLVVIAIIGLLASVVLANLNSARKKGEDAKAITEFNQIRTAFELYYNDNGKYPELGSLTAQCIGGTNCLIANSSIGTQFTVTPAFNYKPSVGHIAAASKGFVFKQITATSSCIMFGLHRAGIISSQPIYYCMQTGTWTPISSNN